MKKRHTAPNQAGKLLDWILYEDAHVIVCRKSAGVATETKKAGQQDMVSLICNYRHGRGEEAYAGTVHRLDQPVEGILVFGKHPQSTAALSRQLAQGSFAKIYLAVTEGRMPDQAGKLQHYLKKDGRTNTSSAVQKSEPGAKKAELYYQVLDMDSSLDPVQNLVKIQLLTGRHHQIRVQMAQIGAPLAGDSKYGSRMAGCVCSSNGTEQNTCSSNGAEQNTCSSKRAEQNTCSSNRSGQHAGGMYCTVQKTGGLGLCACELGFLHPVTKKEMIFRIAPSQPVFQKYGIDPKKWQESGIIQLHNNV